MTDDISIALVGCGAMGANHARVVHESRGAYLGVVIDADRARAEAIAASCGCRASDDPRDAAAADAAIVAAPTELHLEIAMPLLGGGLPVLVEKPLAPSLGDSIRLVEAASASGAVLMCGFVERFNPAFATGRSLLSAPPVHIVATRHSPAAPRIRTSVVADLLIHDIDLVLQLAGGATVSEVHGRTSDPLGRGVEDVADCIVTFDSGLIATFSTSRSSHRKVRQLEINDGERLVEVDLLRQNVDVYRHVRNELVGSTPSYREETIHDITFVRRPGEPLALQFDHFLALIEGTADREREIESLLPPHEVIAHIG